MPSSRPPARLFYSYSRRDAKLCEQLEAHLSLLRRQGYISEWHERCVTAGQEWRNQVDHYLEEAEVILLLISADFLTSDYHYDVEVTRAMERHQRGEARVIPILLRPVDLTGAPFAGLPCLPSNGRPVTNWKDLDRAWKDVAIGLRRALTGGQVETPGWIKLRLGALVGAAVFILSALAALSVLFRQPAHSVLPANATLLRSASCDAQAGGDDGGSAGSVRLVGVRWRDDFTPRFDLTLVNDTDRPAILLSILVDVLRCEPERGIDESRVLSALAAYDVELRCEPGCVRYDLPGPVQIAAKDSVLLNIRMAAFTGPTEQPRLTDPFLEDAYELRFGLRTDKGIAFSTQILDSVALYRRVAFSYCPALLAPGKDSIRQHSALVKKLCR